MSDSHAPLCSICIANFNGENLLVDCIESVLAQQGEIPVEILVHDDASTDTSVALLRERYPDVILIESTENVGFCIANNRLAERARGRYLLLLNNDAALAPDQVGRAAQRQPHDCRGRRGRGARLRRTPRHPPGVRALRSCARCLHRCSRRAHWSDPGRTGGNSLSR